MKLLILTNDPFKGANISATLVSRKIPIESDFVVCAAAGDSLMKKGKYDGVIIDSRIPVHDDGAASSEVAAAFINVYGETHKILVLCEEGDNVDDVKENIYDASRVPRDMISCCNYCDTPVWMYDADRAFAFPK